MVTCLSMSPCFWYLSHLSKTALGSMKSTSPSNRVFSRFDVGDRIVDFLRPDQTGQPQAFYEYPKGKIVILIIVAKFPAKPNTLAILKALSTHFEATEHICVLALAAQAVELNADLKVKLDLQYPIWSDDGAVSTVLTQDLSQSNLRILILDANLRIRNASPNKKVKASPEAICHAIDVTLISLKSSCPPQQIQNLAPVLLVPDVLDTSLCQKLIKTHEQGKTFSSGMVRQIDGKRQMLQDADTKRRIDHLVDNPDLTQAITELLARRLLPEIKKSFHFEPSSFEPLKIVRYDGQDKGFF